MEQEYQMQINRPLPSNGGYPCISIFSGLLGIELGLEWAGFNTALALDLDKDAAEVAEGNRGKLGAYPYLCADINDISPEEVLEKAGLETGEASMFAGGPPCQPFSKSGLRRGMEDDRGLLFKRYLHYLKIIKPQAFLLENVRGIYSSRGGKDFQLILTHFRETGYTIYWDILDAASYGVPQYRQRLFIIGFRDRIKFKFPEPTHGDPVEDSLPLFSDIKPFVTVRDAIGDLEGEGGPQLTGKYAHLVPDIPEGLNYSHYTVERGYPNPIFEWRSKFWYFLLKTDRNKPSLTIQALPGNNTGPFHWKNRKFSIWELARLQSLPDWLEVTKSYMVSHRLIGNAVPPLLAECVGREIKKALDRGEHISKSAYDSLFHLSKKKGGVVRSGRGSGKGKIKGQHA